MGITIADVEGANFDGFIQAGTQLGAHASTLQQQQNTGRQAVTGLSGGWQGQASQAAIANAGRTLDEQQRLTGAVQQVQSVLSQGGSQLAATRTALLQGVQQLTGQGWQVAPDGTVSMQPGGPLDQLAQDSPVTEMQLRQLAATNSVDLKKQLADLQTQDQQLAQKLRDAINGIGGLPEKGPGRDDDPTPPKKPEEPNDKKDTDSSVPGSADKPGDPGYKVPHAPGDPADSPSPPGWKSDAEGAVNPPGYPPMPPGPQRDQNWKDYLSGKNGDGTKRPEGQPPAAYPLPEAVQDKGLKIVGAAENQQGTRYVWGGGSQDGTTSGAPFKGTDKYADDHHDYEHTGFDCSGLSEYAIYQATGYDPGKGSGNQYADWVRDGRGTVVQTAPVLDTSQLQPGDIIYYDGDSGSKGGQHVAIYMGNGVTVETNTSGTPVHSQSVTTSMSGGQIRVVRPNP